MWTWKPWSAGGGSMQYSSPDHFVSSPHSSIASIPCAGSALAAGPPLGAPAGLELVLIGVVAPVGVCELAGAVRELLAAADIELPGELAAPAPAIPELRAAPSPVAADGSGPDPPHAANPTISTDCSAPCFHAIHASHARPIRALRNAETHCSPPWLIQANAQGAESEECVSEASASACPPHIHP